MSKVVLIYPEFLIKDGPRFSVPIGILQLSSYLQSQGVDIKLIDCNVEDHYLEAIYRELDDALCVGISAMTAHLPSARKIAAGIRQRYRGPLVFGGVHGTLFPRQTIEDELVDFVVIGEGELSFLELLEHIEGKRDIREVEGIAFRDQKGVPRVQLRKNRFDFEEMPPINYALLSQNVLNQFGENYIGALTSRGCPHRCTFCINTSVQENNVWRAWKPGRMADEIESILQYGGKKVWFWDENFFVSRKRVEGFLDEIEKRKLEFRWSAEVRADYFRKFIDDKLLQRIRRCGCEKLSMGAESGSKKMLDVYGKEIEVEDIHLAAKKCLSVSIQPTFSFMIGAPEEDEHDIRQTLLAIKKLYDLSADVRVLGPQLFRPYPGSLLYQACRKAGWEEPATLKDWAHIVLNNFKSNDPFRSPWTKSPALVNTVWFYSLFLCVDMKKLLKLFWEYGRIYRKPFWFKVAGSVGVILVALIGRARYKLNFHKGQYEITVLKRFRSVLSS